MFVYYNLILDFPLDADIPWVPFTLKDGGLVCLEELKNRAFHMRESARHAASQELENFLVQTASFKEKSWSLFRAEGHILQTQVGHGGGLLQSSWWSVLLLATDLPGILSCAHWTFLTFKCWTCCFKHLCIFQVQGVASCLADFPPLALLPVVFRLLLRLAKKVSHP